MMAVVRSADAPTFEVPGFEFIGQTAPSRGGTEISTWRLTVLPGASSALHFLDREEVFLVLDGAVVFTLAGADIEAGAGDALSVPAHTTLSLRNPSAEPAHLIACLPSDGKATMADGTEIGTPPWAK